MNPTEQAIPPGLMVLHGNRLEDLRDVLVQWLQRQPLAPLENEVVLVQSNGIAQWFKAALARDRDAGGLGVAAAIEVQLPGRFVWTAYRAVLGADLPQESVFDKSRLVWRLLRMLPQQMEKKAFAALRGYLVDDADLSRRYQLAERIADLFDQYQVYRADWLHDWSAGRDNLRDALGREPRVPHDQSWQPELLRCLLADVGKAAAGTHRAALQQRFLASLAAATTRPSQLPRRIVVFGISSLPRQTLDALHGLSRWCQVLIVVANPCRYYWADIIEQRELLRGAQRRHAGKPGMPVEPDPAELHLHANPLLAAWGKHGRDYLRLLDELDDPDAYRARFSAWGQRIDLFTDTAADSLLAQVQQGILDLNPAAGSPQQRKPVRSGDDSIIFHVAHSPQREVEILHDALLARFEAAAAKGEPLAPREVIVMVPDIETYAAHIRAVFGRVASNDPRYIPFSVADQPARARAPLLIALEHLLRLPDVRLSVSEIGDLLDVPALRRRFELADDDLPTLRRWIAEAGIRWGLDAAQWQSLGLPARSENTWQFGLQRMLLGYAIGDGAGTHGIDPYAEVAGLDARLVGSLADLAACLQRHWQMLGSTATPVQWGVRMRDLLADFFLPEDDADLLALDRLHAALDTWLEATAAAELDEPLPLNVVRESLLAALDDTSLAQRFLSGGVAFATLMPMRAIPFRLIALLGMNDGDYPRQRQSIDFDLMAQPGAYRPGDRSRRDDDRYLFLEALLSARDALHLSWLGRSVRDNSERPASVLIGQLRDHLAAGWYCAVDTPDAPDAGARLLATLTVAHPLQPFSRHYFDASDPRLYTYAQAWRDAHAAAVHTDTSQADPGRLAPWQPETVLNLGQLSAFLRHPVRAFFQQRLNVVFSETEAAADDQEPFALDALQRHQLIETLLAAALQTDDSSSGEHAIAQQAQRLRSSGSLPLGAFAELHLAHPLHMATLAHARYRAELSTWPQAQPRRELQFAQAGLVIEDWLVDLRSAHNGESARITVIAGELSNAKGPPRYYRLIGAWVVHLFAHACGQRFATRVVAADASAVFVPLHTDAAQHHLQRLLDALHAGLSAPLPIAARAAFAWIHSGMGGRTDPATEAARAYDRNESAQYITESDNDAYLQRAFVDFDAMRTAGFERWLDLYSALVEHVQIEVAA